jgi:hypothetical protein
VDESQKSGSHYRVKSKRVQRLGTHAVVILCALKGKAEETQAGAEEVMLKWILNKLAC